MNIRSISSIRKWGWWTVCVYYYRVRHSVLEEVFTRLDRVRCRFVEEQRPAEPPEPEAAVKALGERLAAMHLGEGMYNRFALRQGKRVLAILTDYGSGFPGNFCHCTFTEEFDTVRPVFEAFWKASEGMGAPGGRRVWRRALRRVRRLRLRMVPMELPRYKRPMPILLDIDGDLARYRISSLSNMTTWPW